MSDKKGRKLTIVICGLCTGFSMIGFGFSVNIWMAFFARFLMGFMNGKSVEWGGVIVSENMIFIHFGV